MQTLIKIILVISLMLPIPAFAIDGGDKVDYSQHANCQLFIDDENDDDDRIDVSQAGGTTLVETSGTVSQQITALGDYWGNYRMNISAVDSEWLEQADGQPTDISGADQSITIIARIAIVANATPKTICSKWDDDGNNASYWFGVNADEKLAFTLSSDGTSASGVTCIGDTTLVQGTRYDVMAVYDDTDMRIYIDGILDSSTDNPKTYSSGIYAGTSPFIIGSEEDAQNYWNGTMDNIGVFDTALTVDDAIDIHEYGARGVGAEGNSKVIYLKMDDNGGTSNVDDTGGYADDGEYTDGSGEINTSTGAVNGKVDGALEFDGDEYVDFDESAHLDNLMIMTVTAWVYTTTRSQTQTIISKYDTDGNKRYFRTYLGTGNTDCTLGIYFGSDRGSNQYLYWVSDDEVVAQNEWHHVAIAVNIGDQTCQMYVNGIPVDSTRYRDNAEPVMIPQNISAWSTTYTDVLVGCSRTATVASTFFVGRLDEVTVYDYILTENDVESLADVGAGAQSIINTVTF